MQKRYLIKRWGVADKTPPRDDSEKGDSLTIMWWGQLSKGHIYSQEDIRLILNRTQGFLAGLPFFNVLPTVC